MEHYTVNALICLKDDLGLEYVVSEIEYELWENDVYEYRFRPNYSVIELLDSSVFQGIPGLDLELHRKEYVRRNSVPTFVAERSPSSNREDLWMLLEECDMRYLNRLEWLIRTDTKYIGDRLYVRKPLEGEKVRNLDTEIARLKRSCDVQRKILENICLGLTVEVEGFVIDDRNRKDCYELLCRLYKRESGTLKKLRADGIENAKKNGRYRGRKAIQVDDTKLYEVCRKYRRHQITLEEATAILNMSPSTFYRRIKSLKAD